MSLVSPTQVSDGTTADASDVNTPINQLAAVINGNIDNSNIVAGAAIDGSKLANSSIDIGAKASVFDGWVGVTDSWTYASATTVTVPSDATTKYAPGDKVKFSNGSTKYFTIQTVASTLLTFTGGSDTVANSAISAIYYSKVDTPQTFPGPANPYKFSVYRNAAANTGNGAFAKVSFDTEVYDTNNNFSGGTYTAPIAGFYQFSSFIEVATVSDQVQISVELWKNGAVHKRLGLVSASGAGNHGCGDSVLVQSAASDTWEIYAYASSTKAIQVGATSAWFTGHLISRT